LPTSRATGREATVTLALCVKKDDACGDLHLATLYPIVRDRTAAQEGMLRIVDDSGEDFLYPATYFERLRLRASLARSIGVFPGQS